MAPSPHSYILLSILLILLLTCTPYSSSQANVWDATLSLTADPLDWSSAMPIYPHGGLLEENEIEEDNDGIVSRRSLYYTRHYYISYAALSANRIPCPPRSGRSYYTHNCYMARGPAHPYSRGCSTITRCRM